MPAVARRRWPLIVLAALAAAVVLYALIGYFVAPGLVRDKLQQALGEELSRPVRLERVDIRPFALAATVYGLAVDQPDGKPLLRVVAIEADASIASLWHRAPVVDALRVVPPHLIVARTGETRYKAGSLWTKRMETARIPHTDKTLTERLMGNADPGTNRGHICCGWFPWQGVARQAGAAQRVESRRLLWAH